jgi:hypothetical protein
MRWIADGGGYRERYMQEEEDVKAKSGEKKRNTSPSAAGSVCQFC